MKSSVQAHTIEERNHDIVVANEPLKVLLEDTLTRTAVLLKNSIKTRLCGVGTIATGVKFNPGLTNASDQMPVQIHIGGVGIRNYLSVCTLEVNTIGDGIVHLTFDFPHESVEKRLGRGWGSFPPPHVANIRQPGAPYKGACASSLTGPSGTGLLFNVTFNLTGFNVIQQLQ